jgi:hypothetical protein
MPYRDFLRKLGDYFLQPCRISPINECHRDFTPIIAEGCPWLDGDWAWRWAQKGAAPTPRQTTDKGGSGEMNLELMKMYLLGQPDTTEKTTSSSLN